MAQTLEKWPLRTNTESAPPSLYIDPYNVFFKGAKCWVRLHEINSVTKGEREEMFQQCKRAVLRRLAVAAAICIGVSSSPAHAADEFDPDMVWPLCGRITETPPPGWVETDGCPANRIGDPNYSDAPLAYAYGPRLLTSENDRYDFHRGLDIPTPIGTPLFAVDDGVVKVAGEHSSYADPLIRIRHYRPGETSCSNGGGCYHSQYMHVSDWVVDVDDTVAKGQLIGYSGVPGSGTGWAHLHFEIRNAPAWDPFSAWSRDAINPIKALPYEPANNTTVVFDSVDGTDPNNVRAKITLTSNRFDLASVHMTVKDDQGQVVDQPNNQPDSKGYYVDPAFYDMESTNFLYTHKDSSSFPWASFGQGGENECPYHYEHGSSYSAGLHMDKASALDPQVGDFNGVLIGSASSYWHDNEYDLELEFTKLQGPASCIIAEARFTKGDTTTAEWGNCSQANPPAAPSNLALTKTKIGKGQNAVWQIDLTWQDNASNEDSFILERCEKIGNGNNQTCTYEEIATLPADTTSYSDQPGSGKYKYRVKASNSYGSSAYSNEAAT